MLLKLFASGVTLIRRIGITIFMLVAVAGFCLANFYPLLFDENGARRPFLVSVLSAIILLGVYVFYERVFSPLVVNPDKTTDPLAKRAFRLFLMLLFWLLVCVIFYIIFK